MFVPRACILLALLSPLAASWCDDDCLKERQLEREKDQKNHDCRMCEELKFDDDNCPSKGFDCDPAFKLKPSVLTTTDQCACAQMKCADKDAIFIVDGQRVEKVRCANQTWNTLAGTVAETGVCARPCDACKVLPNLGYEQSDLLTPFVPSPPDVSNPCAFGTCPVGVLASSDTIPRAVYRAPTIPSFTCSGDGLWKMTTDPFTKYTRLQCIKNECLRLPYEPGMPCTVSKCEEPAFVNDFPEEKKMECPDSTYYLRENTMPNVQFSTTCDLGQWYGNGVPIFSTTPVVCIKCLDLTPKIRTGSILGKVLSPPLETGADRQLSCSGKTLVMEFKKPGSSTWGPLDFVAPWPLNSQFRVFCNNNFVWDSTTGVFNGQPMTLVAAKAQGFDWRVYCI